MSHLKVDSGADGKSQKMHSPIMKPWRIAAFLMVPLLAGCLDDGPHEPHRATCESLSMSCEALLFAPVEVHFSRVFVNVTMEDPDGLAAPNDIIARSDWGLAPVDGQASTSSLWMATRLHAGDQIVEVLHTRAGDGWQRDLGSTYIAPAGFPVKFETEGHGFSVRNVGPHASLVSSLLGWGSSVWAVLGSSANVTLQANVSETYWSSETRGEIVDGLQATIGVELVHDGLVRVDFSRRDMALSDPVGLSNELGLRERASRT